MKAPWPLSDLEVVGYAEVLTEWALPSIVPPVLRLRSDPRHALLPPYQLRDGYAYGATTVEEPELLDLAEQEQITLFPGSEAFQAHPQHELWVDLDWNWHYEPQEEAHRRLREIGMDALRKADEALREGNADEALRRETLKIAERQAVREPGTLRGARRPVLCVCGSSGADRCGLRIEDGTGCRPVDPRCPSPTSSPFTASREVWAAAWRC